VLLRPWTVDIESLSKRWRRSMQRRIHAKNLKNCFYELVTSAQEGDSPSIPC
jgi:hypothetical protein